MNANAVAFVIGVLLLVAVGIYGVRCVIEEAARGWHDRIVPLRLRDMRRSRPRGIVKPWYVMLDDRWQAKRCR